MIQLNSHNLYSLCACATVNTPYIYILYTVYYYNSYNRHLVSSSILPLGKRRHREVKLLACAASLGRKGDSNSGNPVSELLCLQTK